MFPGLLAQLRADVSATLLILDTHERLRELILNYDVEVCRRVRVESLQLNNANVTSVDGQEGQEVGFRLSVRARHGAELRRLSLPSRAVPTQLTFEDVAATDVQIEAAGPNEEGGSADDASNDPEQPQ